MYNERLVTAKKRNRRRVVDAKAIIKEHNREYKGCKNIDTEYIKRLRALELSNEQIAEVLTANLTVCNHCWDAPAGCQCWNNE